MATEHTSRHNLSAVSMAIGNPVPGSARLLSVGHRPVRSTALRAPQRQMVDLLDTLGIDGMHRAGVASGLDCDARIDGR